MYFMWWRNVGRVASSILLVLILLSFLVFTDSLLRINVKAETTWIVDDDGPADFPTIQEAVDAANGGDVIFVKAGTYYEHVVVNKSVSLVGENKVTTIIDGSGTTKPIVWVKTNNVNVSEFGIRNAVNRTGILMQDSSASSITNNIITDTHYGVMVQGSSGVMVSSNTLINNDGHGLEIDWSNDINVVGNYISNNTNQGIYVYDSRGCNILENIIVDNDWSGILIQEEGFNLVSHNIIRNNGPVGGVWLFSGTRYNVVRDNDITNNSRGIYIGFWTDYYSGPRNNLIINNSVTSNIVGIGVNYSSGNSFYHNSIANNSIQVETKLGYDNTWDDGYPSGGNYWSDYTDTDSYKGELQNETGGDGVWDNPYVIDGSNQDRYPLAKPLGGPIGDVDGDSDVDIFDIVRMAIVYDVKYPNPQYDRLCDMDLDGDIDIFDIVAAASHYGESW